MKINILNFSQLNDYLEKTEGKLQKNPGKEKAIREKIQRVFNEHLNVVDGTHVVEVERLIRSVKQIASLGGGEDLVESAIDAVAAASGPFGLNTLRHFKEIDKVLYYKSFASYISTKQMPIKSLQLPENELLKIAPWITHLNLTDASDNKLQDCTFTDAFVEKLVESAPNLKSLHIANSRINCSVLSKSENLKGLQTLRLVNCPNFNQSINGLTGLKSLQLEMCPEFNQEINGLPNLRELVFFYCYNLNSTIKDLPSLTKLNFQFCYKYNQRVRELPSLKNLVISSCRAFDSIFDELQGLKTLELTDCLNFNQPIQGLPNLKELRLISLTNFDETLSNLPRLSHLSLSNCPLFNQSLEVFPSLILLAIQNCSAYIQSIKGLPNLKCLMLNNLNNFNEELIDLPKLKKLIIFSCFVFNKDIDRLPRLKSLTIQHCHAFNASLIELPKLEEFDISNCPSFEVKDLPTVRTFAQFGEEFFKQFLDKFSPETRDKLYNELFVLIKEKSKTLEKIPSSIRDDMVLLFFLNMPSEKAEVFFERIPLFSLLVQLMELENFVLLGSDKEEIKAQFASIQQLPNYLDALLVIVHAFPELTSFLIRNLKDEILPDLKKINLSELSLESKLALLPLLSPDQIKEAVLAIPEETKAQWLEEEIEYEQFSGSIEEVLTQIAENNLQEADEQAQNNLLATLKELLANVPFRTLAALASDHPKLLLAFTFVLDEAQMASVIPLLPVKTFIRHLKTQSMPTHREFLLYASTEQKKAYIDQNLFKEPLPIKEWNRAANHIIDLILRFLSEKTKENFQELVNAWREMVHKTNLAAQTYHQFGQSLKALFHNEEYDSYFDPKIERAASILKWLTTKSSEIEKLAGSVEGQVEIPKEFIDEITGDLMKNPYHYPGTPSYIYDFSTWKMLPTHPITGAPVNLAELVPNMKLKTKIEAFKQKHPHIE